MAEIRPFRGIRYNPSVVRDLAKVVCPPYDIVSASQEASLRQRSPYNAIRLELRERHEGEPGEKDRYAVAATIFQEWLDRKVLVPESSPAMYLVEEEFTFGGQTRRRQGLTVLVRAEEFEKGIVLPHEYTRPGPKADRLALMRACRANFSPIMSLYRDAQGEVARLLDQARRGQPTVTSAPNGQSAHRMWVVTDRALLSRLQASMAPLQIFVADGHHRYETALLYRDELGASEGPLPADAAPRFVMMTLISMEDPGLLVLPYHRVIGGLSRDELATLKRGLEKAFHVRPMAPTPGGGDPEAMAGFLENELARQPKNEAVVATLGLEPGAAHLLTLRASHRPAPGAPALERCDMWLLHQKGIRAALGQEREEAGVTFVHDPAEAVGKVLGGEAQVAFLLRALPMDLFAEVVGKGERLPSKSTYFYPKLPTGLVINRLAGEM